jgi:hypothetical protein
VSALLLVPPRASQAQGAAEETPPADADTGEKELTPLENMRLVWPRANFLWQRPPEQTVLRLAASPDQSVMAIVVVMEGEARLRVLAPTGDLRWERSFPSGPPTALRWSADGTLLLVESPCASDAPRSCARTEAYTADGVLRWSREGTLRYRPARVGELAFGHERNREIDRDALVVTGDGTDWTLDDLGIPDGPMRIAAISDDEFALYGPGDRHGQTELRIFDPQEKRTWWAVTFDADYPARGVFPAEIDAGSHQIVWWLPFEERRLARVYSFDRRSGALQWRNFDRLLGMEAGGLLKVEEEENRVLLLTDLTANGQFLYVLDLTSGQVVTTVRVAASHQGGWSFTEDNLAFFGFVGPRRILLSKGGRNSRTVAVVYNQELSNPDVYAFTDLAVVPLRARGSEGKPGLFFSLSGGIVEAWGTAGNGL